MPAYRIFLAGATGAIGRRLIPLLLEAGHSVVGTTRSAAKTGMLRELGVEPVTVDVFDAPALTAAVRAARAQIVIHQLTDLPKDLNPSEMAEGRARNARIRQLGTRNLVDAARAAGVRRMVAQSIAWAYAAGPEPHAESDPLSPDQTGVIALEALTLHSPPLQGVVLRYGQLFGPGTHTQTPLGPAPVHVDAAAYAALLAIDHGTSSIYNVAQPNAYVRTTQATTELGWTADFRVSATPDRASHAAGR